MKHLLSNLGRCPVGWVFWNGFGIDQPSFTIALIGALPSVEAGSANAKIATGFGDMPYLLCVLQYPQFTLYFAFVILRHQYISFLRQEFTEDVSRDGMVAALPDGIVMCQDSGDYSH
jgi:hypothetical protein|tara:strand:- start:2136 stop:2486 length:351 start_codon:yes stop_codon:yes gene_type:complete